MAKSKLNMNLQKGIDAEEEAIKIAQQETKREKELTPIKIIQPEPKPREFVEYKLVHPEKPQDTPQNAQTLEITPDPPQTTNSTSEIKKGENRANTKQKKQVFSFRALSDDIAIWKAYSTASGQTMENIGTAAMNDYLESHKLTGTEQVIFEAMKTKNENK